MSPCQSYCWEDILKPQSGVSRFFMQTDFISQKEVRFFVMYYFHWWISHRNGVFTLSDTETDTETETEDADKLAQNPMGIGVDLCVCAVWTPLCNSKQPIFIGIGKCEHTITSSFMYVQSVVFTGEKVNNSIASALNGCLTLCCWKKNFYQSHLYIRFRCKRTI